MDVSVALLLLASAGGLYLWNLSKAAGNLIYLPGTFTGFSLSGISPEISATLVVQNTSNLSFTINSLAANVLSDGTQVGNVKSFVPTEIPSNSEASVPIILTMQPIGIVNEIISIMTGGVGTRKVVITGSVNANGMQQAFSVEYKLGA
jgi:LEA14-like dessication related protein